MRTGASIFRRADGRFEARYQKGRDENGRIVYGFVYGATREEAERKRAELLRTRYPDAVHPPLPSAESTSSGEEAPRRTGRLRERTAPPYTDTEAAVIDACLLETRDAAAVGLYLCLHLGLSATEVLSLRTSDIDLGASEVHVSDADGAARSLPLTPRTTEFLRSRGVGAHDGARPIVSDGHGTACSSRSFGAAYRRIIRGHVGSSEHTVGRLRSTFIRRLLSSNTNIETVSHLTGLERATLYRVYGAYIQADPAAIYRLDGDASVTPPHKRRLNLLILGAGSHGQSVKETAERLGVFQEIRFLDDRVSGTDVIGRCEDYKAYLEQYPAMFPAFGDNELRRKWVKRLRAAGAILPRLVHPDTTISARVTIEDATIILSQVTVNAGVEIGEGVIVSAGSMIGYDAKICDFVHLDSGSIVQKNASVDCMTTVESGEIVRAGGWCVK